MFCPQHHWCWEPNTCQVQISPFKKKGGAILQFVMDWLRYMADPDQTLDWEDILEISMSTTEAPKCPICLGPPVAGRITKCGHIYCWHCMIHHMSCEAINGCNTCPLCENFVYSRSQTLWHRSPFSKWCPQFWI